MIFRRRPKTASIPLEDAPEAFGDILVPAGAGHPTRSNVDLQVSSDHVVPVGSLGGTTTLANLAGPDVYWSDNAQVSASSNRGTISAGSSQVFTQPAWVIGSSNNRSMCRVTLLGIVNVTVGLGAATDVPTSDGAGGYAWGPQSGGGGGGQVNSVVAGTSIAVDDTDPTNPVVSVPGSTFDAFGAAATAQANAEAASDPVGSAAAAQAASLQKSSNLSDVANAGTARTNLGLGTAATHASTDFDAAGSASTAQTNAQTFARGAVATETTRAEAAEALLAPKASPALTGTPTVPTATPGTNTTQAASTAFVEAAVGGGGAVSSVFTRTGAVVATSGDYTVAQVTGAAPLASPGLTGSPTAPTQTTGDNTTKVATDAFVTTAVATETTRATTAEGLLAPKASPALTGTPAAPTATLGTNTTQIATTAFVLANSSGGSTGLGPATARRDATYLGKQVAVTRAQTPYNANFSYPTGASIPTFRQQFTAGPQAISDIEVNFGNWTSFPGDGGLYGAAATASVKASLEYNGNFYALYFNGLRTVVLGGDANGGASAWSDPIGIEIPAGATFFIRCLFTPSTGTAAPLSNMPGGWSQAGDHVDATGTLTTTISATAYGYGCNSIRAVAAARVPQIAVIGDSRAMGFGDATAGLGYIGRALGGNFVSQNLAALGETLTDFVGAGHWLRGKLIASADYSIEEYGINDLSASVTAATVQAGRITVWNTLGQRGIKTYADTLWPESTSTNGWTTTGAQTAAAWNAARSTVNQWIRAGAPMVSGAAVAPGTGGAITVPVYTWNGSSFTVVAGSGTGHPLAGCFDSSSLIETAVFQSGGGTDSGIFKVGAGSVAWTGDGIHLNATGCAVAQAAINTSLFV